MVAEDVQEVLESLAEAVGRGVSVDDPGGRVIAHSAHHGDTDPVRARAILSRTVPPEVGEWQRAHGAATATGPVRIPANPVLGMDARLCVSLLHGGRRLGYLWVIEGERPLTAAETDRVVRDAATVAALLDVPPSPGGTRGIVRRLLLGDADGRGDAAEELQALGAVTRDRPYRVLVSRPTAPGRASVPAAHTVIDGRVVVITSDGTPAAPPTATDRSATTLGGPAEAGRLLAAPEWRALLDALTPGSAVGVSAPHDRLDDAPEAYRQALAASRAAAADPAVGPVAVWPSIGVYRFFAAPGEQTGPMELLKARDPRGVLAATLEVYLDSGGDAQATAEATHLHRTSLYYRLRRIEEITGRDLRDGHHRLELHLALKSARWAATA